MFSGHINSSISIDSSIIQNCCASYKGGGIYAILDNEVNTESSILLLTNILFEKNIA